MLHVRIERRSGRNPDIGSGRLDPFDGRGRRANDAIRNGTAHIELRTRLDTSQTELVLVPTDGSEPLWLTRTEPSD